MTAEKENLASTDEAEASVEKEWKKEGRCPNCGTPMYGFVYRKAAMGFRRKKKHVPLTVPGQCHQGRCLKCHPPEDESEAADQSITSKEQSVVEVNTKPVWVFDTASAADAEEVGRFITEELEKLMAKTNTDDFDDAFSSILEHLPASIPLSINMPGEEQRESPQIFIEPSVTSVSISGPRKKYTRRPLTYDDIDNGSLAPTISHISRNSASSALPQMVAISPESSMDKNNTPSALPQMVAISPNSSSSESDLTSAYHEKVLLEIHGLSSATDSQQVHRHLVRLRTMSIVHQSRVEIAKTGGIPIIIRCLKRFGGDSKSVAKQVCALIQNVVSAEGNAQAVSDLGGAANIVQAMETHQSCPGVQEHGCAALRNLVATEVDARTIAGKVGAVQAVIGAMRYHRGSVKVCDKGLATLANLSLRHPENRMMIGKEGGVGVILQAMRDHSGNEGVSEKGMKTLRSLIQTNINLELLSTEEGIADLLLGVGMRFPKTCKNMSIQIFLKM